MSSYFVKYRNRVQGPFSEAQLREMARQNQLSPLHMVSTDNQNWTPAPEVQGLFPQAAPPSRAATNAPTASPDEQYSWLDKRLDQRDAKTATSWRNTTRIKTLNFYFMVFWISRAIAIAMGPLAILLPVTGSNLFGHDRNVEAFLAALLGGFGILFIIHLFLSVTGMVFFYMLLYQLWKLIPIDIARTTPCKAVGLFFIPFFNLYWLFVALPRLGEDMNKTLRQNGCQYQVNEGLVLTSCLLMFYCGLGGLFFNVPVITILTPALFAFFILFSLATNVPTFIVTIFALKSIKDGAIALLETDTGAQQ